ncbi:MAG: hypothetical protein U5R48_13005 [Gammaproteobacteria bacterium]|nr:hypothetical protein [Gammaproteobacteria bacterium]
MKRNLLVFLRPTILRDRESVAEATRDKYRGVWEVTPEDSAEDPETPDIESLYRGRAVEE